MEVASSSSPRSNKRKSEDISVMDCEVQMEKKPKDVGGARVYKESANFEEDVHRTDELSVDEVRETNKCIADLLQPEETVLQALFRFKGGRKEAMPEQLKDIFNHSAGEVKGTTTCALGFDGGVVLGVDSRSSNEDTIDSDVEVKLRRIGTTRVISLAGQRKPAVKIADILHERLQADEDANLGIETVKQSADSITEHFEKSEEKPDVEFVVAGWDTMEKEGPPVMWYSNSSVYHQLVDGQKTTGCGRSPAACVLHSENYKSTMNEATVISIAEKAILAGALSYWKTGGSVNIWILRNGGEIIEMPRQTMEELAIKYKVPIEELQQP